MTPIFQIILNDHDDITGYVQDNLCNLSVTDSIDERADSCQIVLADHRQRLSVPDKGGQLTIFMGYSNIGLQKMGSFFITGVTLSGPPDLLSINADSANLINELKIPKQKNWNGRTLGVILRTIAAESRSEACIQDGLESYFFDNLSQDNESDHQFLRRIALMIGAIYKPNGRKLAMITRDSQKSVSGQPLKPVKLSLNQLLSWDYRQTDRAFFDVVRTWWHDEWSGQYKEIFTAINEKKRHEVTEKKPDGNIYTLRQYFKTKDLAVSESKSMLQRLLKKNEQVTLSTPGDTRLLCEVPVTITGGRAELNRQWLVSEATHSLSMSGYVTDAVLTPFVPV